MHEAGVDISRRESARLAPELLAWADLVVTVCKQADESCPALPHGTRKNHWPLNDPATATGTDEEIMQVFRASRDPIHLRHQPGRGATHPRSGAPLGGGTLGTEGAWMR